MTDTEIELLHALKLMFDRSSSEYWPVEQEVARQAIENAEKRIEQQGRAAL